MKVLIFLSGFLLIPYLSVAQTPFHIEIMRMSSESNCTMGYLSVNEEVICYTLELPWADNQNNISCIPIGTYSGILRYDKSDGWRIQLENVPNRSGVQIHMGNYTRQIKGCVLVGTDADVDSCSVFGSADAYSTLKTKFYGTGDPISSPNKDITITFK